MENIRTISTIIKGQMTSDGAGVKLKRILGSQELPQWDPFLLLDEFKNDDPDQYMAGFPDHPHRGFETITYLLAGAFTHRDSRGNEGHLKAGAVQWMTAGKGVIHSEMPEQTDGLSWGYQLWLNLPAKLKMVEPRYQDIPAEDIPVVEMDGVRAKIIAGEYGGKKSGTKTWYPVSYFDLLLAPGAVFEHPAPRDQNAFIYVIEGKVKSVPEGKSSSVPQGHLGLFGPGDRVKVSAEDGKPVHLLFASAQRMEEPIVRGGPFVLNTIGELKQAFLDYQTGKLG